MVSTLFFFSTIMFYLLQLTINKNVVLYHILMVLVLILGFVLGKQRSILPYGYLCNIDVALVGVFVMYIGNLCKLYSIEKIKPAWGGYY